MGNCPTRNRKATPEASVTTTEDSPRLLVKATTKLEADVTSISTETSPVKEETTTKLAQLVYVIGGPGAGKGTQCEKLVNDYGFTHYSTGDLLRAELKSESEEARRMKAIMSEGKLVPSEMIVGLLKKNITETCKAKENVRILLDGFPRNFENVNTWKACDMDEVCSEKVLIYFDCTLETMQERLIGRGKTGERSDDNIETIKKRLQTFVNETKPIIEHFERLGKVVRIDCERDIDSIHADIVKKLGELELL